MRRYLLAGGGVVAVMLAVALVVQRCAGYGAASTQPAAVTAEPATLQTRLGHDSVSGGTPLPDGSVRHRVDFSADSALHIARPPAPGLPHVDG